MEQKYFSKKEAAIILGVHPRTVERYLLSGKIKGARLGKEWKVSQTDIDAFYERAKTETEKTLNAETKRDSEHHSGLTKEI